MSVDETVAVLNRCSNGIMACYHRLYRIRVLSRASYLSAGFFLSAL